jgi:hypothetical protein
MARTVLRQFGLGWPAHEIDDVFMTIFAEYPEKLVEAARSLEARKVVIAQVARLARSRLPFPCSIEPLLEHASAHLAHADGRIKNMSFTEGRDPGNDALTGLG